MHLTDAKLVLRWDHWAVQDRGEAGVITRQQTDTMRVTAGPSGHHRACGLPPDVTIEYWAEALGHSSDTATVRLAEGEAVSRAIRVPLGQAGAAAGASDARNAAERPGPVDDRGGDGVITRPMIERYVQRGAVDIIDILRMYDRGSLRIRPLMSGANPGGG